MKKMHAEYSAILLLYHLEALSLLAYAILFAAVDPREEGLSGHVDKALEDLSAHRMGPFQP